MRSFAFAAKELRRRKSSTLLMVLGSAASVASAIFLLLVGKHFGARVEIATGDSAMGFSSMFSQFILLVTLLDLLIGVLAVFFLFSSTMTERVQDIGIMKSFGCLTDSVFRIFAAELLLIVVSGGVLGALMGLIPFLLIYGLANPSVLASLDWLQVLLVPLGFSLFAHIIGARPIAKAIQMKPADAISLSHLRGSTTEFSGRSLSKLGLTAKVAFRGLMRRALPTRNLFVCLTAVSLLLTLAVVGGLVASRTTVSYLERAVGRDIVLVGHKDLVNRYEDLLLQFQTQAPLEALDCLKLQYTIPDAVVQELAGISGVTHIERRLLFEAGVSEGYGFVHFPFAPGAGQFIGQGRSGRACVVAINPDEALNDWFIEGAPLSSDAPRQALIGHSLANNLFTSPFDQEIIVTNKNYEIAGICIDPLNNGNVTYVPFNTLDSSVKAFGFNLVYLKIDPSTRSQFFPQLSDTLAETDYGSLELNYPLNENIAFLESIWSWVMLLPFSSLAGAVLCLFTFVSFSVTAQRREFRIMRAVGAKLNTIAKISIIQISIILLASILSGFLVGLALVYLFLIPDPAMPIATLYPSVLLFLSATLFLALSALVTALRMTGKAVAQGLNADV